MASLRVAFAIACVLTVAVWRSQAFLLSRPAGATGAKFGGFESHAARVVTLKSGPPPPQAEKPTLIEAAAFDGPAAKAIASPGNSDAGFEVAAVAPFSLSFHVCKGFANQRLSIIYAAILAKETGRSLYLPKLLLDGTQHNTTKEASLINSDATEFSKFYDVDAFVDGVKAAGIQVTGNEPGYHAPTDKHAIRVPSQDLQSLIEPGLSNQLRHQTHLSVECPLFKLDADLVGRHRELVERVLSSLVPAPAQRAKIDQLKASLGKFGHYNVLHLRIERDWISHCKTWVSDRGVCLAQEAVSAIGEHLDLKGVSRSTQLYIACDVPSADSGLLTAAMKSLKTMGYKKITLQGQTDTKEKSERSKKAPSKLLDREIRAMHAYYLGIESSKYIGNSVSTFSALLILERQNRNRWSTYYNMGGIPLMDMLPFFRMPWVFTYNGESPGFDYMAKSAVLSAIHVGQVIPYCIYMGDKGDEMYRWLKRQGVHVVLHDPSWKVKIVQKYDEAKKFAKAAATYESITSLVATFMRFDIPIVHALNQYNYVLYTDVDVLFLRKTDLHSFPPELPEAMSMAFEMDDRFPCNAGVVLYNLPYLRQSYHDLVTFAMHAPGLHFGDEYGPADQGALNQFYEGELGSQCSLPEKFNAKPYKLGDLDSLDDVFILHFHGPKPKHYLDFANNRGCGPFSRDVGGGEFVRLCREGLRNLCELQLEIPKAMLSEGSWGSLSDLKSTGCKKFFADA